MLEDFKMVRKNALNEAVTVIQVSALRRGQRRRGEVDAKAGAPDRDGFVFIQVDGRRNLIVLIALVALQRTEIDEASLFDRVVALSDFRGGKINMHIGTIG